MNFNFRSALLRGASIVTASVVLAPLSAFAEPVLVPGPGMGDSYEISVDAQLGNFGPDVLAPLPGPVFVIEDLGGVGPNTEARAGFEAAAARWSNAFVDPVTIRLALGFAPLAPNVLAQAGSFVATVNYATVRNALDADRTSFQDNRAVAGLPTGPSFAFLSNEPGTCPTCGPIDATSRTIDNDGTFDNLNVRVNTSVIKALDLAGDVYARDAQITFSSNFAFDFDASDGITPGSFDFVGIAVHEIGHALGFRSGVDTVDFNALPLGGATPPPRSGLDNIAYVTVWDLFRYDDGVLAFTVGGDPCASYDTGETCGPLMSTGAFNGDLRQASHWKDNLGIGIMDPTFARGEIGVISQNDLTAFDSFGWDLRNSVPEPGVVTLFGLGFAGLIAARRRRAA